MKRGILLTVWMLLTSLGCQDKSSAPTSTGASPVPPSTQSSAATTTVSASASAQPRAPTCTGALVPVWHLEKRTGENVYSRDKAALQNDRRVFSISLAFFLCDAGGNDLAPLYACRTKGKDLISADEKCEGGTSQGLLGYAAMTKGPGTNPLLLLVNAKTGDHFYTPNPDQAAVQKQSGAYRAEPFFAAFVWLRPD